jgi:hypothetical protein
VKAEFLYLTENLSKAADVFVQEIKARNKSNHVARKVDILEMWELISNIPRLEA